MNYSNCQVFTYPETVVLLDIIKSELDSRVYSAGFAACNFDHLSILKSAYDKLSMFEPIADDVDESEDLVWKSIYNLQDSINMIVGRLELLESEQDDLK